MTLPFPSSSAAPPTRKKTVRLDWKQRFALYNLLATWREKLDGRSLSANSIAEDAAKELKFEVSSKHVLPILKHLGILTQRMERRRDVLPFGEGKEIEQLQRTIHDQRQAHEALQVKHKILKQRVEFIEIELGLREKLEEHVRRLRAQESLP